MYVVYSCTDFLLADFKWYRKWRKGHWELWYDHYKDLNFWIRLDRCSGEHGFTNIPNTLGKPFCEDYTSK